MNRSGPLRPAAIAALSGALAFGLLPSAALAVSVVVNGTPVQFDQRPVERGGRVFVPLRGVFEQLGASVVYSGGVINATGNGRNIQLRIGSTQALVDGQPTYLDVAPFVIGARTLVPLRFVSQALGANVDYNYGTQVVAVTMPTAGAPAPAAPPPNPVGLHTLTPKNGANVESKRPEISAKFSQAVDPNSVKITLDGRDVTTGAYMSPNDFAFTPAYDLPSTQHNVQVSGRSQSGAQFSHTWAFISGTSQVRNYLSNLSPASGATVGSTFTISGTTLPDSHVKVVAQGAVNAGGIFRVGTGSFIGETIADHNGRFSQQVEMTTPSGSSVGVQVISSHPNTNASATANLNYATQ